MTPQELKAARKRLNLSAAAFETALGYASTGRNRGRWVRRLEAGDGTITPRTAMMVRHLLDEAERRAAE